MEGFTTLLNLVSATLGFEFILIIPTFALVGVMSSAFRPRERFPEWKNLILAIFCILSGFAISSSMVDFESVRDLVRHSVMLGSVSALSYQFSKPVAKAIVKALILKFSKKIGEDIIIEEDEIGRRRS